jgi:hypothetical protein
MTTLYNRHGVARLKISTLGSVRRREALAPRWPSDIPPLWRDDRGPLAIALGYGLTTI